jgi:hypothetical protein
MKIQLQLNNTRRAPKRNLIVAHSDGSIDIRINGRWFRRVLKVRVPESDNFTLQASREDDPTLPRPNGQQTPTASSRL